MGEQLSYRESEKREISEGLNSMERLQGGLECMA